MFTYQTMGPFAGAYGRRGHLLGRRLALGLRWDSLVKLALGRYIVVVTRLAL